MIAGRTSQRPTETREPHIRLLTTTALLTLVACAGPSTERHSAEITSAFHVDSIPVFDVGDIDSSSEPILTYASGATRLSNGMIVISDAYAHTVRYFDSKGTPVRLVGRAGEGPNEFDQIWWLRQCGPDTVHVWEPLQQRMTVLDSAGTIVNRYRWGRLPIFIECSKRGVFIAQSAAVSGIPSVTAPRQKSPVWLARQNGDTIRTVGDVPFVENRPLGRITQFAVSDSLYYVGTADSAVVDVFRLDGTVAKTFSFGERTAEATEAHYEAALNEWVKEFPGRAEQEQGKRMLRQRLPKPAKLPAYSDIILDSEGIAWVVFSAGGDPVTRLKAKTLDGSGTVEMTIPKDFVVYEIGNDYVLGRYEDANTGAHHVAMYRLHRS